MEYLNGGIYGRRTERVATNLTVAELGIIKLRMEERGIAKVSDYLRLMALGEFQAPILVVPEVNNLLAKQITGTMSNINRLTRLLNTYPATPENTENAAGLKAHLSNLLHKSITTLVGRIDYDIVRQLCTEKLETRDLELALVEHRKRNAL